MADFGKLLAKLQKEGSDRDAGQPKQKCPKNCKPAIFVMVARSDTAEVLSSITVEVSKPTNQKKPSGTDGFAKFDPSRLGAHNVRVALTADQQKKFLPPQTVNLSTVNGKTATLLRLLDPLSNLTVKVIRSTDKKIVGEVPLHVSKLPQMATNKDTGIAIFTGLKAGKYQVLPKLTPALLAHYATAAPVQVDLPPGVDRTVTIELRPSMRVYLKFLFKDPQGKERVFPKDFAFKLLFDDGSALKAQLGAGGQVVDVGGKLGLGLDPKSKAFTLDFDQKQADASLRTYVVCEKADADPQTQELVYESNPQTAGSKLRTLLDKAHRAFRLPDGVWTLKNSNWTVRKAQKFSNFKFTDLDKADAKVGTPGEPVELVLDPHWQFYRFEFFDRRYGHPNHSHKPISALWLELNAYRNGPAASPPPPTEIYSNWTIDPGNDAAKKVQCLPWIIQKKPDGTADAKPDKNSLLLFSTKPHSLIHSKSATVRETVVLDPTTPADAAKLKPSADRLSYYDLPVMWRSQSYWCRLSDAAADQGFWTDMAAKATTRDKPLIFSLDDIILTDAARVPLTVTNTDRVTIFANTFAKDSARKLDQIGLYDADTAKPYFSKQGAPFKKAINYLNEYPAWTRLVIMGGNLFDAFDQRTPDHASRVVGARAAVRWFDATAPLTAAQVTLPAGGAAPSNHPVPGRILTSNTAGNWPVPHTHQDFFELQPFYSQFVEECRSADRPAPSPPTVYREWQTAYTNQFFQNNRVGRFDLVLLRCCDADVDKEVGLVMHFFRFNFNFITNAAALPQGAPGVTTKTTTPLQDQFILDTVGNIMKRWNGPDAPQNPGRGRVVPVAPATKFRCDIIWFLQATPLNQAHFRLDVVASGPTARAFMASERGEGMLTDTSATVSGDGTFVAAHECGHGGSHFDEYNEQWSTASYEQLGFTSWIAGDPFREDDDNDAAIMNGNKRVRGRYYWHVAEWLRRLPAFSTVNFQVERPDVPETYKIEHYPHNRPGRTFINWPLAALLRGQPNGANTLADLFLARLGPDSYARDVLTRHHNPAGGATFDGILIIKVKIEVVFTNVTVFDHIQQALIAMSNIVTNNQNHRRAAKFTINAGGSLGNLVFNRCLLHFSPRWLVPTYINTSQRYNGLLGLPNANPTTPVQVTANANAYAAIVQPPQGVEAFHPPHWGLEIANTTPYADGPKLAGSPPTTGPLAGSTNKFGLRFPIPGVGAPNYASLASRFHTIFLQMLGLTSANFLQPNANKPFVQALLPPADHASITML